MSDANEFDMTWPGKGLLEVTPDDNTDLTPHPRALWIGGVGAVSVEMVDGTEGVFSQAQGLLPIRVKKVKATGTTATGIVGIY